MRVWHAHLHCLVFCTLNCLLSPGLHWLVGGHCRVAVPGAAGIQAADAPARHVCWWWRVFGQHSWRIGERMHP